MTDWMTVRVVLEGSIAERLAEPPGRIILVHADHTFAELAEAVDTAFARWDLTPPHEFRVEGRRVISGSALRAADEGDLEAEDSDDVTLGEAGLRLGARFSYLFDPGEGWLHDCTVEAIGVDPFEVYGEEPPRPQPVFGWGQIPDQYGRITDEDDDEDEAELTEMLQAGAANDAGSWDVVAEALGDLEAEPDEDGLAAVIERLREHREGDWPYDVLWAASGLEDEPLPDDADLWLELAAGVVAPVLPVPLDPDAAASWVALEPADWAGAVIELVRAGAGQPADPEELLELIARCPEVEGDELTEEDEDVLLTGLETVTALWQALGALDDDRRLTPLGVWGLPESLRVAWTRDAD